MSQLMSYLRKANDVYHKDGLEGVIKQGIPFVYDEIVEWLLPQTTAKYNGVTVMAANYGDEILPFRRGDREHYEARIVTGLNEFAQDGDDVVIVGGGWGVTAVYAAKETGNSGGVTVYEGARRSVDRVCETTALNGVENQVDVHHSIVGPAIDLHGMPDGATHVAPDELPECNVLELDCEGAELAILKNLTIRPRVILVESHGVFGAPSADVEKLLHELSYEVISKAPSDKPAIEHCKEQDIYTFVAVHHSEDDRLEALGYT